MIRPAILVVEDEPIILDLLGDILAREGYSIVPAGGVDCAVEAVRSMRFNAAVLDIHLGGGTVLPVVDELVASGTPVIFASAYFGELPQQYRHIPLLRKPISLDGLLAWLAAAVRRRD
ncbi:MAG: response regulator [Alphaproteobacteria bacterium]